MIVAFDECSIINSFAIPVPTAWQGSFGKMLKSRNYDKLNAIIEKKKPYRFIPSRIDIVKQAQTLIGDITFMPQVLLNEIKKSIDKFDLSDWGTINRNQDIADIKRLFCSNERDLKKFPKIPSDEDFEIIAGYRDFDSNQAKILISYDEHFWGYKDLIFSEFGIKVVEEWNAHVVARKLGEAK